MNLPALFEPSLTQRSEHDGLQFQGVTFTFGQIEARSNRLSHRLVAAGLDPGDRVAVYVKNCVEMIEIYLACVKTGFIFTPINVLYLGGEIEHILSDAGPKLLISHREFEKIIAPVTTGQTGLQHWHIEDIPSLTADQPDHSPPTNLTDDTVASLVYTSGTTGRPKGAMLTHGNFTANARNLIECWRLTENDRLLLPLPLFHVHGLANGMHTWLALGYRMRLLGRFQKETILDEMLSYRPTVFFGVPTMYTRLLETPPETARKIGSHIRLFVSGSAPLPAATLEQFRDLFGHVILERYGMSETLMNISNPYEGERRPGSVGCPLPDVSIRLCNPETGLPVPEGGSGEVLIKGPNVFAGYWRNPVATSDAFDADGYFRSGDLGNRSRDGYYTLQGRLKELIICGGFNIYPREVEEFFLGQPGVLEAAVVGVADPVKGEVPVLFFVPDPTAPASFESLIKAGRNGLASFKIPRRFLITNTLPRNALGKVQKHLLLSRLD